MRLDTVSTANINTGAAISPQQSRQSAVTLAEGDVVDVRVMSSEDGMVTLRSEGGQIFRARVEDGVSLSPGDNVRLMVTQQTGDVIVMSLAEPNVVSGDMRRAQASPVAEAFARLLVSIGVRPNAENIAAMKELLSAFPDLPVNEAAFMAANKLEPEPGILSALHQAFTGGADMASMLDGLQTAANHAAVMTNSGAGSLPSANTAYSEANIQKPLPRAAAQPVTQAHTPSLDKPVSFGQWLADTLDIPRESVTVEGTLAEAPAFEGLSKRSMAAIAGSLASIAKSMPELGGDAALFEGIAKLAEEQFFRMDDPAEAAAGKLKSAREELYVKLSFFRDAVELSGSGSRRMVLEQTQRLMDHIRLLSGLDQFVCLQLPVQVGERRENAELYVYKREKDGTKRIDPDDVRILLCLDLEHAGHLETYIEIKDKAVSLKFEVENEGIALAFRRGTPGLHELLSEAGYKFANSNVAVKKRETGLETALLSMLEHENSLRASVDYRI